MLLDIHSHRPAPYPEGVISVEIGDFNPMEGQFYSVGIHPWNTAEALPDDIFERLEKAASEPGVVAVGEAGVDPNKGAPMFRQLQVFRRQMEISESVGKPLVIHMVKSADVILGLKRDLHPSQPWIIHGFRGKPQLAKQLADAGLYLSLGEKFNPESLAAIPEDKLLAETDESLRPIETIIANLSTAAGHDLTPRIVANLDRLLHLRG